MTTIHIMYSYNVVPLRRGPALCHGAQDFGSQRGGTIAHGAGAQEAIFANICQ